MIDVITYTSNLSGLKDWLSVKKNDYDEISYDSGGVWINVAKVPTRSSGNHSVSLLRLEDMGFLIDAPLEILAMGDNPFELLDEDGVAKVELALNRQESPVYDEDGEFLYNYIEPLNFGVIA